MEPKSTKKIMEELFADKLSDLGFNKSKQRTWYKIVNEKNLIVIYGDRTYYDEYVDDIYFEYHLCLFPAHTYQDLDFHILDNVTSFNTSSIYYCLEKKNGRKWSSMWSYKEKDIVISFFDEKITPLIKQINDYDSRIESINWIYTTFLYNAKYEDDFAHHIAINDQLYQKKYDIALRNLLKWKELDDRLKANKPDIEETIPPEEFSPKYIEYLKACEELYNEKMLYLNALQTGDKDYICKVVKERQSANEEKTLKMWKKYFRIKD